MEFNQPSAIVTAAARSIRLLLLDVDGVLTDGKLYFGNSGEELKAFNTLDGHGIKMLKSVGIDVGIITGRSSNALEKRAGDLGITLLIQGREDKGNALDEILSTRSLSTEQIAYAGDDFPDLAVMRRVGLSFSVPGGHPEVRGMAHAVTGVSGGNGAVREICDFILQAQDRYRPFFEP